MYLQAMYMRFAFLSAGWNKWLKDLQGDLKNSLLFKRSCYTIPQATTITELKDQDFQSTDPWYRLACTLSNATSGAIQLIFSVFRLCSFVLFVCFCTQPLFSFNLLSLSYRSNTPYSKWTWYDIVANELYVYAPLSFVITSTSFAISEIVRASWSGVNPTSHSWTLSIIIGRHVRRLRQSRATNPALLFVCYLFLRVQGPFIRLFFTNWLS